MRVIMAADLSDWEDGDPGSAQIAYDLIDLRSLITAWHDGDRFRYFSLLAAIREADRESGLLSVALAHLDRAMTAYYGGDFDVFLEDLDEHIAWHARRSLG